MKIYRLPINTTAYSRLILSSLLLQLSLLTFPVSAQQINPVTTDSLAQQQTVNYPSSFFSKYNPETALDMVKQLPGFQLDDGSEERGFSAAAGNVLINGGRPSAKEDSPSAILGRIPARQVDHIELVQGQMRGVDLRGQTIVANVVLREEIPATIRWETGVRKNLDVDKVTVRGNVSLSDQWQAIDFNTGLSVEKSSTGEGGTGDKFNGKSLLIEKRDEQSIETGYKLGGNLNASGWLGQTLVQLNTNIDRMTEDEPFTSIRTPQSPINRPRQELFNADRKDLQYELGMNAERKLNTDLTGKAILIYNRDEYDEIDTQRSIAATGNQTQYRIADSKTIGSESIGRLEFGWTGMTDHEWQLNAETAQNVLDGTLDQRVDKGLGSVAVDVPGANTRVEELRGDFLLKDTWSFGQFELDYGVGAEKSRISQTGDTDLKRDFFFIKPHMVLTYTPSQGRQTRVRLAREVAQLDFDDFVSSTVYIDDDLALGNPNLRPDTTWIAELGEELRFGELSVVKVTLFHHWINDVLDLLPLSATFEAPGNIGNGKRWGLELESTIPLEWTGLAGARLDLKYRWQDSSVEDPVTGVQRMLSGNKGFGGTPYIKFRDENRYAFIADFRQDFEAARVAWGLNTGMRARRVLYKVNELDIYDEGITLNAFIESTRWFGIKMRLLAENIPDLSQQRDRSSFTGARNLSVVEFREITTGHEGVRLSFLTSGSF